MLPIQNDRVGSCGNTLEEALALSCKNCLCRAAVHVHFRDLYDLDGEVASEPPQVVFAALGRPPFKCSDGDDGGAPDHSISKSWLTVLRRS